MRRSSVSDLLLIVIIAVIPINLEAKRSWSEIEKIDEKKEAILKTLVGKEKIRVEENEETTKLRTPTKEEKERGYIVFVRDYLKMIYPNTIPKPEEIKTSVKIFATPGEYEPVSIGVYALEDLKGMTVEAGNLVDKDGGKISKDNIKIHFIRCTINLINVNMKIIKKIPDILDERIKQDVPKGETKQVWVTINVPSGTKAGTYSNEIKVTAIGHKSVSLNLELEVLPFVLKERPDAVFWYSYWDYLPESAEAFKEELKSLREHGINGFQLDIPPIKKNGSQVEVDFTSGPQGGFVGVMKLLQEYGFKYVDLCEIYKKMNRSMGKDYIWTPVLKQIVEKSKGQNWPKIVYELDEPRENKPDINFEHASKYLGWFKQASATSLLCIMRAADKHTDKDYVPLVGMSDIVMTHGWSESKKLVEEAHKTGKTLWLYNNGMNRISFGFFTWFYGASGCEQYTCITNYDEDCNITRQRYLTPVAMYHSKFGDLFITLKHEFVREGIDDFKYIYTLESMIKDAKKNGNAEAAKASEKSAKVLADIRKQIPEDLMAGVISGDEAGDTYEGDLNDSLNEWRYQIAQEIIKLQKYSPAEK